MIGPYFFGEYDEQGELQPINVDAAAYLRMLEDFVVPALMQRNFLQRCIFQQDGAPAHTAHITRQFLENRFGLERVISKFFPNFWPARSPDLAPCDYFLWGYLKSLVYASQPRTLEALCNEITRCAATITPQQMQSAVDHLLFRLQIVMDNGGDHIEHLLK
jgi:hypothetical protein